MAQLTDAIVIVVFCSIMTILFFTILNKTLGMRSAEEAEINGLDMPEMGAMAYPDFLEAQGPVFAPVEQAGAVSAKALREELVR